MKQAILVGVGGFGQAWVHDFLTSVQDVLTVAAIADIQPDALESARVHLDLPEDRAFTSASDMIARVDADVCILVIQPQFRTELIRQAAARGMDILCEKPLGATWEQCLEIAQIVQDADVHLAVIQNYRETPRIRALESALHVADLGQVRLAQCRMAVDYTTETAGGALRWQYPDAFIYEGAVHHLDQMRNLLGSEPVWVSGVQWNPAGSTFPHPTSLLLTAGMENGTIVRLEMNHSERGHQNGWHSEFYRLSCERGALTIDADHRVTCTRHTWEDGEIADIADPTPDITDGHERQIRVFLAWLDGGPLPETWIGDNLRTMALVHAAIRATYERRTVDLTEFPIPEPWR